MDDSKMNGHLDALLRVNRVLLSSIIMDLPVPLVQTFLTAARYEGLTVSELNEKIPANRSTLSRQLLDLSSTLRDGRPGHGLLTRVPKPDDLRSVMLVLSDKGKNVMKMIEEAMEA